MNKELMEALDILEKEKEISKETLFEAIENSLITACKNHFGKSDNIKVEIDRDTCDFLCYAEKEVVEEVEDDCLQISLDDAQKIKATAELGDILHVEIKSKEFGRIATQNAKNVILQKIREEERSVIYNQYFEKEKDIVTGIVQRYVGKNVSINLGKADAMLTENEQVKGEVFRPTERIKVYILEVKSTPKGPRINVSRTHPELVKRLFESEVTEIKDNGDTKIVVTDSGEYEARAVIIATGATHRLPGLDREFDFIGNGISFCAVCDGAFYEGKTVAVLGGGNSALQEAILLSDLCKKVYVVQNLEVLTGEKKLQEQLSKKDNVEIITLAKITELLGDSELNGIKIEANGKEQTLEVDGLFVAIGLIPQNKQFENVIALDKWGYADSDEACVTKTAGIFVAGDCRKKRIRQVATACADGAIAALAACDFIDSESK